MKRADREVRLQDAKEIGRIAYRLARDAKIEGYIEIDHGRFLVREWHRDFLSIKLYDAANIAPRDEDLSELRVLYAGAKVFEIRWDEIGLFKVVAFKPGNWERTLRAWPAPVPFD